jgi:hypothetical protein
MNQLVVVEDYNLQALIKQWVDSCTNNLRTLLNHADFAKAEQFFMEVLSKREDIISTQSYSDGRVFGLVSKEPDRKAQVIVSSPEDNTLELKLFVGKWSSETPYLCWGLFIDLDKITKPWDLCLPTKTIQGVKEIYRL